MSNPSSDQAKKIIEGLMYATMATVCEDGTPWNTPVYCAYDENYDFYWGSHVDSQHSRNIASNPNVFLVMYDSTTPAGDGSGVYIKATATRVIDSEEIATGHSILKQRGGYMPWAADEMQSESPVGLYRATPKAFWINRDSELDGTFIDIRVKLNLLEP